MNTVTNAAGNPYVTAPSAFHKFVDPFVDDCFGISCRSAILWRLVDREVRVASAIFLHCFPKLIEAEVVPTAIGEDYRVDQPVQLRQLRRSRLFFMSVKSDNSLACPGAGRPARPAIRDVRWPGGRSNARAQATNCNEQTQDRDILEVLRSGPPSAMALTKGAALRKSLGRSSSAVRAVPPFKSRTAPIRVRRWVPA